VTLRCTELTFFNPKRGALGARWLRHAKPFLGLYRSFSRATEQTQHGGVRRRNLRLSENGLLNPNMFTTPWAPSPSASYRIGVWLGDSFHKDPA
jgi:hypothetical protein